MKNKKRIIILFCITLLFFTISFTFGKYIFNSTKKYYLTSKGFYFKSDLLNVNSKLNTNLKWNGSNIEFNLTNSENDELVTEYAISYKLTCNVLGDQKEYIKCNLNDTEENSYNGVLSSDSYCINTTDDTDVTSYGKKQCEIEGYTWNKQKSTKTHYFNLELLDNEKEIEEVEVEVKAESTSPYKTTLVGIFNLNYYKDDSENTKIDLEKYYDYEELSITNLSDYNKCYEITFDNTKLINNDIDNTIGNEVDENNKVNKITIEVPSKKYYSYKFYKIDKASSITLEDFSIKNIEC